MLMKRIIIYKKSFPQLYSCPLMATFTTKLIVLLLTVLTVSIPATSYTFNSGINGAILMDFYKLNQSIMKHQSFIKAYSKLSQEQKLELEKTEIRERLQRAEDNFHWEDFRKNPMPNDKIWILEINIRSRGAWPSSPLFTDHYPYNVYLTPEDAEKAMSIIVNKYMPLITNQICGNIQQMEIPFLEKIK